jgi:hypothetical protein
MNKQSLSFEQILTLVRQLPQEEQIELRHEIEKNLIKQQIQCRSQTFKSLIEQVQPVSSTVNSRKAKEEYLNQKYDL